MTRGAVRCSAWFGDGSLSERELNIISGPHRIDGSRDARKQRSKQRKPVRGKLENRELASAEVLLVSQILVGGDKYIEDAFELREESAVDGACEPCSCTVVTVWFWRMPLSGSGTFSSRITFMARASG